jgi:hypothetical protein
MVTMSQKEFQRVRVIENASAATGRRTTVPRLLGMEMDEELDW